MGNFWLYEISVKDFLDEFDLVNEENRKHYYKILECFFIEQNAKYYQDFLGGVKIPPMIIPCIPSGDSFAFCEAVALPGGHAYLKGKFYSRKNEKLLDGKSIIEIGEKNSIRNNIYNFCNHATNSLEKRNASYILTNLAAKYILSTHNGSGEIDWRLYPIELGSLKNKTHSAKIDLFWKSFILRNCALEVIMNSTSEELNKRFFISKNKEIHEFVQEEKRRLYFELGGK